MGISPSRFSLITVVLAGTGKSQEGWRGQEDRACGCGPGKPRESAIWSGQHVSAGLWGYFLSLVLILSWPFCLSACGAMQARASLFPTMAIGTAWRAGCPLWNRRPPPFAGAHHQSVPVLKYSWACLLVIDSWRHAACEAAYAATGLLQKCFR